MVGTMAVLGLVTLLNVQAPRRWRASSGCCWSAPWRP